MSMLESILFIRKQVSWKNIVHPVKESDVGKDIVQRPKSEHQYVGDRCCSFGGK